MRHDIDRRPRRLKDVLSDESIRRDFLKGVPKNDAKVVKAFVAANASNALKTRPKVSYSALSLLFPRVRQLSSCLWPSLACLSVGIVASHRVQSGSGVSIEDARLPSVDGFNVRHSHRRVFESEVGIGDR
jgi:hypothetical protein